MKDNILAHITGMLKPLKVTVDQTQQRWYNQCQAVISRKRSLKGQSCSLRHVNNGTPLAPS